MSTRHLFVVPSLFVFLITSFCTPDAVRAQVDLPDWAESRAHSALPDTRRLPKMPRAGNEEIDRAPVRRRPPFSRYRSSSGGWAPGAAEPNAGPPTPGEPSNEVPLPGSGLVLLGAAGAGYAVRKLSLEDDSPAG